MTTHWTARATPALLLQRFQESLRIAYIDKSCSLPELEGNILRYTRSLPYLILILKWRGIGLSLIHIWLECYQKGWYQDRKQLRLDREKRRASGWYLSYDSFTKEEELHLFYFFIKRYSTQFSTGQALSWSGASPLQPDGRMWGDKRQCRLKAKKVEAHRR